MRKNIHVFYHLYQGHAWKDVYNEQMDLLEGCGLPSAAVIHIGVVGDQALDRVPSGARVTRWPDNREKRDTMEMLRDCCAADPSAAVLFFHTKGTFHPSEGQNAWRRYMDGAVVKPWRENIELLSGNDCVGVDWREGPKPHFSGTFWWANAAFVNGLDHSYLNSMCRYDQEFWIGSTVHSKGARVVALHEAGWPHYEAPYPEERWVDRLGPTQYHIYPPPA